MISEKIKERARKLRSLSIKGVGGEKDNAKTMYEEFLKKHNIQEKDIDAKKNERKMKVKNEDDALSL